VAPGIEKLGREDLRLGLAISLNATTDRARTQLIPLNKRYPIARLLSAAEGYARASGRPVTFEYVLMAGLNDSAEDARRLGDLVQGVRSKINIIPYNPVPNKPFRRPDDQKVKRFMDLLSSRCRAVTLRESKGGDIQAACGQLRGEVSSEDRPVSSATIRRTGR
jgi:23S rRNA (adenine2503-C2)-methyltransferase